MELEERIETRLAETEPEVELIKLDRLGRERLRLYIDRPEGVDLDLCERVTRQLTDLLEDYALEVSSPGLDRPLAKPEHFQRFLGRQVRVRTSEPIEGQRSFTGTLVAASGSEVRIDWGEGAIAIPHARIRRSNLIPEEDRDR